MSIASVEHLDKLRAAPQDAASPAVRGGAPRFPCQWVASPLAPLVSFILLLYRLMRLLGNILDPHTLASPKRGARGLNAAQELRMVL